MFHFVLVFVVENWGTEVQPSKTQRNNTPQCFAGEKSHSILIHREGFLLAHSVFAIPLLCEFGKWLNSFVICKAR